MVVVPNYALCPAVTIETIALQMTRALAWTWRHAALYGGDPQRIVVAGHSAGGHLAAMLLSCRWKAVARDLPARAGARRAVDLGPVRPRAAAAHAVPAGRPAADAGLGAAAEPGVLPARRAARCTPRSARDESDEFLRQNQLIRDAWGADRRAGVRDRSPGANHLDVLHDLADPHGRLHELALQPARLR